MCVGITDVWSNTAVSISPPMTNCVPAGATNRSSEASAAGRASVCVWGSQGHCDS